MLSMGSDGHPATMDTSSHGAHSSGPQLVLSLPTPQEKHQHITQILAKVGLLRKASLPTKRPGQVSSGWFQLYPNPQLCNSLICTCLPC